MPPYGSWSSLKFEDLFTTTLPARSSRKQRSALSSERVNTAACSANGVLFAASIASSSVA
jgi:hypothetical protein